MIIIHNVTPHVLIILNWLNKTTSLDIYIWALLYTNMKKILNF